MTVQTIATAEDEIQVSGAGYSPHGGFIREGAETLSADLPGVLELARAALLCNDAALHEKDGGWHLEGDPTEGALVALALKAGLTCGRKRGTPTSSPGPARNTSCAWWAHSAPTGTWSP
jgi:magnesium-transporting ATPase (P-type)